MATCEHCGTEILSEDPFCRACGQPTGAGQGPVKGAPGRPLVDEQSVRAKAEKRVKERYELLEHMGIYVVVNAFLVGIWALTGAGYPWFLWPLGGWGVGLAIHILTFITSSRAERYKDRLIEKEMDRLRGGGGA